MVQVQNPASAVDGTDTSQPSPTILIVEDSFPLMESMALTLETLGYRIVRAADGREGMDKFEQESPDLVLLDLKLPVVSGFRLLRIFKSSAAGKKVPVIVVTAMDFEEAAEVAAAGADDFLTKPFHVDQLARKVGFILGQPQGAPQPA
jgi:two-component system, OmpR family, phosphate regulon response regulator PhoB